MRFATALGVALAISGCNYPDVRFEASGGKRPASFGPSVIPCFSLETAGHAKGTLSDVNGDLQAVFFDTTYSEPCTICVVNSDRPRSDSTDNFTIPYSFNSFEDGVYFYKVETADTAIVRMLILMK